MTTQFSDCNNYDFHIIIHLFFFFEQHVRYIEEREHEINNNYSF
jgi:hypothetical protein